MADDNDPSYADASMKTMARVYRVLYLAYLKEGFTEEQAMRLVIASITKAS